MFKCKFRNCQHTIESLDPDKCIYHAECAKKDLKQFEHEFEKLIKNGDETFLGFIFNEFPSCLINHETKKYSFRNCIFENNIVLDKREFFAELDFTLATFKNGISCVKTTFHNNVSFFHTIFKSDSFDTDFSECDSFDTDFSECNFFGSITKFRNAEFRTPSTHFNLIHIEKTKAFFQYAEFYGDLLEFENFNFIEGNNNFENIKFHTKNINFSDIDFGTGKTYFDNSKFLSEKTSFNNCRFMNKLSFDSNIFKGEISFNNIKFDVNCKFTFRNPLLPNSDENIPIFKFIKCNFIPGSTFFEDIFVEYVIDKNNIFSSPIFIFRYCSLNEVDFSQNNMSLFSFYTCRHFEKANIVSCDWAKRDDRIMGIIPFVHHHLIFEEIFFTNIENLDSKSITERLKTYEFKNSLYFNDIADLYRRFKYSLDQEKNYETSGWFYFNEFEMKSLHFKNNKEYLKYLMYKLYFCFFGYGEKPFWGALWFIPSFIFFSIFHMLNGIQIVNGTGDVISFNYKFSISYQGLCNFFNADFWSNFGTACSFNFNRIIPSAYKIYSDNVLMTQTDTFCDHLLSFSNTFVLASLLIFIGIGLKRHFRRF